MFNVQYSMFNFYARVRAKKLSHAGALFLRCKGTTFALRLTNNSAIIFEIFSRSWRSWSRWSKLFLGVKNRHYNINILFIYSEQNDRFEIHFDQNDLDQNNHTENAVKSC